MVDPPSNVPYEMSFWSAKSSADSIGVDILSTVKKAAKFAVYDDMIIRVKNHHIPPTILVDAALGFKSDLKNEKGVIKFVISLDNFYL